MKKLLAMFLSVCMIAALAACGQSAAAPAPAAEQTTGITAGMVVVGMVTLAGLAFALYKAI